MAFALDVSTTLERSAGLAYEERARQALMRCLQGVSELQFKGLGLTEVEQGRGGVSTYSADLAVEIVWKGRSWLLYAEVLPVGEPRLVRAALAQIKQEQTLISSHGLNHWILMAPTISSASAQLCLEAGVGYADFSGNCHLAFDGLFIHIEGRLSIAKETRPLRSLYSPKAERVLRVLLQAPQRVWKTQELADEAQVSLGQVAKVKELLSVREWLDSERIDFRLTAPQALLRDWGQSYAFNRSVAYDFYAPDALPLAEKRLVAACAERGELCALTAFSGAEHRAPITRYRRAFAYVAGGILALSQQLGWKPVDSGANVRLLKPYDEGVFYGMSSIDDLPIVSDVQLYLDCLHAGGRGEEAAEFLWQQKLFPHSENSLLPASEFQDQQHDL